MIHTLDLIPNGSQRSGHTPTCRVLVNLDGLAKICDLFVTNRDSLDQLDNLFISLRHNSAEIVDLPMEFSHGLVDAGHRTIALSEFLVTKQRRLPQLHEKLKFVRLARSKAQQLEVR